MLAKLRELFQTVDQTANDDERVSIPLAAAALLLEVAWADHEIDASEIETMTTALSTMYGLDRAQTEEVVDKARADHESSTGMQSFTRFLTEQLTRQERVTLLEHLWRLASFGGDRYHYEEHVIRRITDLLYLNHSDFIAAKRVVQNSGNRHRSAD